MNGQATRAPEAGRLLLFGCGNMAGAMLLRWIERGLDPARVTVIRPSAAPVADGVAVFADVAAWRAAGHAADTLMIGIKPQMLNAAAEDISAALDPGTGVVSLLAGARIDDHRAVLPDARTILRAMPNTPVRVGRGVVALAAEPSVANADLAAVDALMAPLGTTLWLEDESQFDLVSAFTGSGPGFVYRLIDAYAAAGARLGLSRDAADAMARATFDGALALLAASDEAPADLAARVASKGGMTQAGFDVFDDDGRLIALFADTLRAARDRGAALAASTRGA